MKTTSDESDPNESEKRMPDDLPAWLGEHGRYRWANDHPAAGIRDGNHAVGRYRDTKSNRTSPHYVAAKQYRRGEADIAQSERRRMKQLEHSRLVLRTEGAVYLRDGGVWVLTEWMDAGTVAWAIYAGRRFDTAEARRIAIALLQALSACHNAEPYGIAVGDIAAENIFLTSVKRDTSVVLGDFDHALEAAAPAPVGGRDAYRPGLLRSAADSDAYAAGVVIWEVACGRRAFTLADASSEPPHVAVREGIEATLPDLADVRLRDAVEALLDAPDRGGRKAIEAAQAALHAPSTRNTPRREAPEEAPPAATEPDPVAGRSTPAVEDEAGLVAAAEFDDGGAVTDPLPSEPERPVRRAGSSPPEDPPATVDAPPAAGRPRRRRRGSAGRLKLVSGIAVSGLLAALAAALAATGAFSPSGDEPRAAQALPAVFSSQLVTECVAKSFDDKPQPQTGTRCRRPGTTAAVDFMQFGSAAQASRVMAAHFRRGVTQPCPAVGAQTFSSDLYLVGSSRVAGRLACGRGKHGFVLGWTDAARRLLVITEGERDQVGAWWADTVAALRYSSRSAREIAKAAAKLRAARAARRLAQTRLLTFVKRRLPAAGSAQVCRQPKRLAARTNAQLVCRIDHYRVVYSRFATGDARDSFVSHQLAGLRHVPQPPGICSWTTWNGLNMDGTRSHGKLDYRGGRAHAVVLWTFSGEPVIGVAEPRLSHAESFCQVWANKQSPPESRSGL